MQFFVLNVNRETENAANVGCRVLFRVAYLRPTASLSLRKHDHATERMIETVPVLYSWSIFISIFERSFIWYAGIKGP